MDRLKDKNYKSYDYINRYATIPYYYNELDDKYIYGISKSLDNTTSYTIHTVQDYDTLDLLALTYYGRPDFYWIIADYNKISDPLISLPRNFKTIKIPSLAGIKFKGNN